MKDGYVEIRACNAHIDENGDLTFDWEMSFIDEVTELGDGHYQHKLTPAGKALNALLQEYGQKSQLFR